MADFDTDVLIIGSGAAGAAVAKSLSSRGVKVVCLEQGRWIAPSTFPSSQTDWEVQLKRGPWHFSPNVRALPEDYPVIGAGAHPPDILMFNAVGGSTVHWTGHFPRFRPSDFRVRSLDGVADDWPLTYEELEPYYDLNDADIGVSGLAGDPANPPRSPRQSPPLPVGELGETVARGFTKLGWHWWVADNAIISRKYRGRKACTLQGRCMMGCPTGAKASTDVTHWPTAIEQGAVLKTNARVREVTLDDRGNAKGVLYYDQDGRLQEEKARVVVICCNGIGTPRLLLNSKSALFPQGLANSSGLVGKNFMIHPFRFIEGVFEESIRGWTGPFGIPLFSQEFYETDTRRGFVRGYTFQVERSFGPVHQAWGGFTGDPIPWGESHHRVMKERFGHMLRVTFLGEDLPDERNSVTLDPDITDSHGIPAARVTYDYSQNSLRMHEHARQRATELLESSGARTILDSGVIQPAFHLMGTARMGNNPSRSVVNRWNQSHDVKNLFIVDGSSFVTGAGVNPTSTIGALALRAADSIWERRAEW